MAEHDDKIYNELYSFLKDSLSDCKVASFVLYSFQILFWLGTFKFAHDFAHDKSHNIKKILSTNFEDKHIIIRGKDFFPGIVDPATKSVLKTPDKIITVPGEIQKILIALSAISFFPKIKLETKLGVITDSSIKKLIQNMRLKIKKNPTIK